MLYDYYFRLFDNVSVPDDITNKKLKVKLNEKIVNGDFCIGEKIVPQKFKKVALRDGHIEETLQIVEGIDLI